jgi:hypothetical protein
MSHGKTLKFIGMAAVAASLACASNSTRDDAAGYQGMSRDTTVRDTTVLRDTMMVRDTAAQRVGDTTFVQSRDTTAGSTMQRGGNLPDQQIQQRSADSTATPSSSDSSSMRSSTDTSAARPQTSTGTPQH